MKNTVKIRPSRILWACPYCLLDTSSGCSMSCRDLLRQLKGHGIDVYILSSTVFDRENGALLLRDHWDMLQKNCGKMIDVEDGDLVHHIIPVKSTDRYSMTCREEGTFYAYFIQALNTFKPDLYYFYGGQILEMILAAEAAERKVPVAAYLANGEYSEARWCRDVDVVLTGSRATAEMYFKKDGYRPIPIGSPISHERVLADVHTRQHVLFINPSPSKGSYIVATLAYMLEKNRPDIIFEVVESRAQWKDSVQSVTEALGDPREELSNVIVIQHTSDIKSVYGRARLTLLPSLWWENYARTAIESMVNGIPCIVSDRGGLPEAIQGAGLVVTFPEECYKPPYTTFVRPESLTGITDFIEKCFDDPAYYQLYVSKAQAVGRSHKEDGTMKAFLTAVKHLLKKRAGDKIYTIQKSDSHKEEKNSLCDTKSVP